MTEITVAVDDQTEVSALLREADTPHALLVLAHGAGAGMRHAFMESVSERLAAAGVSTLRYQFPYMERGGRRPDSARVAVRTVRAAVERGRALAADVPLFAGGKSFGGRMTSTAAAEAPLPGVEGIIFIGFPLHAPNRSGTARAAHLDDVSVPMLFLQGTRDRLAGLDDVEAVCRGLGSAATLHVVDGGDHSFHVLKRSGRTDPEALDEIARTIAAWTSR